MKALASTFVVLCLGASLAVAADADPQRPIAAPNEACSQLIDGFWGTRQERQDYAKGLLVPATSSDWLGKLKPSAAPSNDPKRALSQVLEACAELLSVPSAKVEREATKTEDLAKGAPPAPVSKQPVSATDISVLRDDARRYHRQYKALKHLREAAGLSRGPKEAAFRTQTHAAMDAAGLRGEDISARFVSGFALTDVGGTGAGDPEDKTIPQGHIVWSTRHWGGEQADLNLGGRIGFQPALSLFVPDEEAEAPEGEDAVADYQEAFVWDVGLSGNLHAGPFQFSAQGRAGQIRLGSDSVLVKTEPAMIVVPLQNGEAKWFWEAGVKACLYRQTVDVLHEQNGLTAPSLEVSAGFRRDLRFDNDAAKVIFNDPSDRRYFRFALNGISVRDFPGDSKETAQPKMFTLSFAVEHEWGREGGVPAATRFLINGNVDLLRALRGDRP